MHINGEAEEPPPPRRFFHRLWASLAQGRRATAEAELQVKVDMRLLGARSDAFSGSGAGSFGRSRSHDRSHRSLGRRDCCRGRDHLCRACVRERLFLHRSK